MYIYDNLCCHEFQVMSAYFSVVHVHCMPDHSMLIEQESRSIHYTNSIHGTVRVVWLLCITLWEIRIPAIRNWVETNMRMYIYMYFVLLDYYGINIPSVFPTFRINYMYMYGAWCINNQPLYTQTWEHFLYECGYWHNDKQNSFTAWNTMFVCLLKSQHLLDQEAHFLVFIHTSIVVVYMYIYITYTVPIIGYVVCVRISNWTSDSKCQTHTCTCLLLYKC